MINSIRDLNILNEVDIYNSNSVKNPKVSVVITTYNHEAFIESCLESVLNQKTSFEFNIYLGEDDSTDNTRNICKQITNKHRDLISLFLHKRENVIYFEGTPTGRFNQLYTLFQSNSEYIAFCEGDDYWIDENKLQKQYDLMIKNRELSGCCHLTNVESDNKQELWRNFDYSEVSIQNFLESKYTFIHSSSIFFKKSCLNFSDKILTLPSGDIFMFVVILKQGNLAFINEVMSVYRKHSNGITMTKIHKKNFIKNRILYLNEMNLFLEKKYSTIINNTIAQLKTDNKNILIPKILNKIKSIKTSLFNKT